MTDYVKAYNDKTNHNHNRAHELIAWADKDTYVVDGVLRWSLNDRVPPLDILDLFAEFKPVEFDLDASCKALDEETSRFIAEYRERRANMTEEQLAEEAFERRAAFGEGQEVVNIITGEVFNT